MKRLSLLLVLISITLFSFGKMGDTLFVGTQESVPFVIKQSDGTWGGVCIDLLDKMSNQLGKPYKLVEMNTTYNDMVNRIDKGVIDFFVGSMTITGDRLQKVNFTQPYYISSISVATNMDTSVSILSAFFSAKFFKGVLILLAFLFCCGFIFWLIERNNEENPEIDSSYWGIFQGAYYVSIIVTTIGFGEMVKTKGGKILGFILMWVSLGIVGLIYGNITTALTVSELQNDITDIQELRKVKVGTINGTTSANFLKENDVKYISFDNIEEALDAMNNSELNAFVYDSPILKYYSSKSKYKDIKVMEQPNTKEMYGFATSLENSNLTNKLNPSILNTISSPEWDDILAKYNLK
jgi:polar amino acid transport system substrate-binding protein